MRPTFIIILLCLMPDDFTRQRESVPLNGFKNIQTKCLAEAAK